MEIVVLIVAVFLLWGIIKAINHKAETDLAIKEADLMVKTAEAAAVAAVNRMNSVIKPIMERFEDAKREGHVLEWADRYITAVGKVTGKDYDEMYWLLKEHGFADDPEYQRAIDAESKRRGLPCRYYVSESEWEDAWDEGEFPALDVTRESTMCGKCDDTNDEDTLGEDLVNLKLEPYRKCPFCGAPTTTSADYKDVASVMEDHERDVARWKDFAERHPERARKMEAEAREKYRRERLDEAEELDERIKEAKARA